MGNKYTHGGLPASEALMWDKKTCQRLGDILYRLSTGDSEKRRKAVSDYWEMKRHFIKEDFEDYIDVLDAFRKRTGHVPMQELIINATKEIVYDVGFILSDPEVANTPTLTFSTIAQCDIIQEENTKKIVGSTKKTMDLKGPEIKVEQLSLF